jgi:AmmeMemoRadiSam system protein A
MFSKEEEKQLLEIARKAIARHFSGDDGDLCGGSTPAMKQQCGAFVTLHKKGALRGCIGYIRGLMPLDKTIGELAVKAAIDDPRFPSLKQPELAQVDIEISVLSPFEKIEDPTEVVVGKHGLYITNGYSSGLLLPQVATEYGWDRETFLEQTCRKAGLSPDAWKDPDTDIEVFSGVIFGEKS